MEKTMGRYSFIAGVILALVLGLAAGVMGEHTEGILASFLVLLGIIVGFLNVSGKESRQFLIVAAVLVLVAGVGGATQSLDNIMFIGEYMAGIFDQLLAFLIPATIVVALKEIGSIAKG